MWLPDLKIAEFMSPSPPFLVEHGILSFVKPRFHRLFSSFSHASARSVPGHQVGRRSGPFSVRQRLFLFRELAGEGGSERIFRCFCRPS